MGALNCKRMAPPRRVNSGALSGLACQFFVAEDGARYDAKIEGVMEITIGGFS